MFEIAELTPAETHPLRRSLLRDGTASDQVAFDGDDLPNTLHLGVRVQGDLVAISSWMQVRYPDLPEHPAHQLRGMATTAAHRGTGVSAALLAEGVRRCAAAGSTVVWARARVAALGFYERHDFEPRGVEYVDITTGLAHRDIVRFLP